MRDVRAFGIVIFLAIFLVSYSLFHKTLSSDQVYWISVVIIPLVFISANFFLISRQFIVKLLVNALPFLLASWLFLKPALAPSADPEALPITLAVLTYWFGSSSLIITVLHLIVLWRSKVKGNVAGGNQP